MKVRKEVTIAIFIGLIFGLVVVGGIIRARQALKNVVSTSSRIIPKPTSSPAEHASDLFLEISTPDNQVFETDKITLSGKTNPAGYIVILGEKGEYITTPGETGNFSQEISLTKGANTIIITVYLENGTKVEKMLTAVSTTGV